MGAAASSSEKPEDREAIEKEDGFARGRGRRAVADRSGCSNVRDEDVKDAFFVVSTPQDAVLSAAAFVRLRIATAFCCVASISRPTGSSRWLQSRRPDRCGFAILTAGLAPRVGKKILKQALAGARWTRVSRGLWNASAQLREEAARRSAPSYRTDALARRKAMIEAAEGFTAEGDGFTLSKLGGRRRRER